MLFTTVHFALFASLFYVAYALIGHRFPVLFIGAFSLFFYGWWDPHYLPLILASAAIDFYCSQRIYTTKNETHRRIWLWLAVVVNLSILGYFKYWNFAATEITKATGFELAMHSFVLPLGLSFYTLQTLGYTIDVYRRKIAAERKFTVYLLYVSFFPQLVAGPIERAGRLLPQLKNLKPVLLRKFCEGFTIVLWGVFIKMVVADNLAPFVGPALRVENSGLLLWFVCLGGMFQIYCDFYGYTLIARGLAKAIGVELSENFRQPFFAKTLTGFWQAWHITLTRWIIDYVHIPLARRAPTEPMRSIVAISAMCLIGFWHGASWNFILFGLMNGLVLRLWNPLAKNLGYIPVAKIIREFFSRFCLIAFLAFSTPFFMLHDLYEIASVLRNLFSTQLELQSLMMVPNKISFLVGGIFAICVVLNDWGIKYKKSWHIEAVAENNLGLSSIYGIILILLIVLFANTGGAEFVYFQF